MLSSYVAKAGQLGLILALSAAASGCALLPKPRPRVHVRPVAPVAQTAGQRDDADYAAAVAAIDARDYLAALDDLEAARALAGESARVLNAFGVVYDKLGRFDVSARYYAKARALDPGSMVIANNIAYSQRLREGAATSSESPRAFVATRPRTEPPPLASTPRLVQVGPGILALQLPTSGSSTMERPS